MIISPASKLTKLGDLVNILQQYHDKSEYIYTDDVFAQEMIEFLLTLFDTKLVLLRNKPDNYLEVETTWTNDSNYKKFGTMIWSPVSYKKSINLPLQKKHIVCQFDCRTKVSWNRTISSKNIFTICKSIGEIYNIGDNHIDGTINCTNFSLSEKYELLSTSSFYIGINSGLSHLALMTNSNVFILYEHPNNPWFFYPDDSNILEINKFLSNIKSLIYF